MKQVFIEFLWKLIYKTLHLLLPRERIKTIERNYLPVSRIRTIETIVQAISSQESVEDGVLVPISKTFEPKELFYLRDAILDTKTGYIFLEENTSEFTFFESSSEWPKNFVKPLISLPKNSQLKNVLSASVGFPNINYFHLTTHWLANAIRLSRDAHPLVLSPYSHKFSSEIIALFDLRKIEVTSRWIRVQDLAVMNPSPLGYLHPMDVKIIKSGVRSKGSGERKIYVSRKHSSRSIPGESMLETKLIERGFLVMYAENYSYEEQVRLFSEAKFILGPHGAGLVNAIYSATTVHILEIMPEWRFNRCIEWQAGVCGHKYERLFYSKTEDKLKFINRILKLVDNYE